jgi:hypothetical protein
MYSGWRRHLALPDQWFFGGTRLSLNKNVSFDLGGDLFTGENGTYFGDLKVKNRVYAVFNWNLENT